MLLPARHSAETLDKLGFDRLANYKDTRRLFMKALTVSVARVSVLNSGSIHRPRVHA